MVDHMFSRKMYVLISYTSQNAKENDMGKLKKEKGIGKMMSFNLQIYWPGKDFLQAARSIPAELAILHEVSE
jgi:hypothetical protein